MVVIHRQWHLPDTGVRFSPAPRMNCTSCAQPLSEKNSGLLCEHCRKLSYQKFKTGIRRGKLTYVTGNLRLHYGLGGQSPFPEKDQAKIKLGLIYGWRRFELAKKGPEALVGPHSGTIFPTTPEAARCGSNRYAGAGCTDCPSYDCTCGYYAYHTLGEMLPEVHVSTFDGWYGLVEGWGRTAIHASGFRSQYMRLHTLVLPATYLAIPRFKDRKVLKRLGERYGCKTLIATPEEILIGKRGKDLPNIVRGSAYNWDGVHRPATIDNREVPLETYNEVLGIGNKRENEEF